MTAISRKAILAATPVKDDPELMESIREWRKRGRPKTQQPKVRTSIYLSQAVLDKFKSTGPGWQTRINDVLEAVDLADTSGHAS
jgi:uncharacterized protein (DUF4415 family)